MDRAQETLSAYSSALRYHDLPAQTVHQVKRTLIDTLACAIGGFSSKPAVIARTLARGINATAPARLLGAKDTTAPDLAAFANGVAIRYLDYNDSYFSPGGGHPSDTISASLAAADACAADGKSLIASAALAYEAFCRLSDQIVLRRNGWDNGIFIAIGAACAAGNIMGLDREAMGHAISLAAVPNLSLGVTRTGELSMWKGAAAAASARAGLFAAQLAHLGMTGPDLPFAGRKGLCDQLGAPDTSLAPLGGGSEPFRIMDTITKNYPSQIHTQAPIGLALALRPRLTGESPHSIHIRTYSDAASSPSIDPEKWDPKTRETADHSIPFLVASALRYGEITPGSFSPDRIAEPALRPLISRTITEEDPDFTHRYPSEFNCWLEVTTQTGRRFEASAIFPKGHHRNPFSDSDLEDKFHRLSSGSLTHDQQRRVLDLLWSLETLPTLQPLHHALLLSP